jgi:hypothetical protein
METLLSSCRIFAKEPPEREPRTPEPVEDPPPTPPDAPQPIEDPLPDSARGPVRRTSPDGLSTATRALRFRSSPGDAEFVRKSIMTLNLTFVDQGQSANLDEAVPSAPFVCYRTESFIVASQRFTNF